MITLETERLILRPFTENDFDAVQTYASNTDNLKFMLWGPNSEEDTRYFLKATIERYNVEPVLQYSFAVVLKESGNLIGGCEIFVKDKNEAELGWILNKDYWKNGYGTEFAHELLRFGFEELKLHRIFASCDSENYGSFRVMERNGMRKEAHFIKNRNHKGEWRDEFIYTLLEEDWEVQKEIAYYNSLPVIFKNFIELPKIYDSEIELVCIGKNPENLEKKYVPSYEFEICKDNIRVGLIGLRIGYTDGLYYGGQIGYAVDAMYRGYGYAEKACRLLIPVIKAHGMKKLLITNNHTNIASKRTCEKLGAKLLRVARLPEWHDLYKEGQRFENVFEWNII